jgi:hypothetical protein
MAWRDELQKPLSEALMLKDWHLKSAAGGNGESIDIMY